MSVVDNNRDEARRTFLKSAGLALGATSFSTAALAKSFANPSSGDGHRSIAKSSSDYPTLASEPESGVNYRSVNYMNFRPSSSGSSYGTGDWGVYAQFGAILFATMDIPDNARLWDVEWYVKNSGLNTAAGYVELWYPGLVKGSPAANLATTTFPTGDQNLRSFKTTFDSSITGPFPPGSKLYFWTSRFQDGLEFNGARVGFVEGGGMAANLPQPIKVFDTQLVGGRMQKNEVREIDLADFFQSRQPTAVLLNVGTLEGQTGGRLKIWPTEYSKVGPSTACFGADPSVAHCYVPLLASRKLKVTVTRPAHVIVNILSWSS